MQVGAYEGTSTNNKTVGVDQMDIVRVAEKLKAFREAYPPTEYAIRQDFAEDVVGSTSRVTGHCRIIAIDTGAVLAEAYGTRALREPVPGAQGHRDTRDPDRAMTQALGRALGLLGYADANGIEGDTDEADETGISRAAAPPPQPPHPSTNPATAARAKLRSTPAGWTSTSVDTSNLKAVLNDLDPAMRGKVRAGLSMAGLPTDIPDQLLIDKFTEVESFIHNEIDNLKGAS